MKLYHHPLSPFCQKTMMALYEKGFSFESVFVNPSDPEERAAYREINPLGKVPMLVRDDGWRIPESSIIIEYVDAHADGPRLIPEDPDLARQSRFHDRIGDLYLIDPAATLFFAARGPEQARDAAAVAQAEETLGTVLAIADRELASRDYMLGSEFTFADISPFIGVTTAKHAGFSIDGLPNLTAWYDRILQRSSAQRVLAEAQEFMATMG